MSGIVLTYEGYALELSQNGYRSVIDGKALRFDTAGQWKQFIDYKNGKRQKRGHRN